MPRLPPVIRAVLPRTLNSSSILMSRSRKLQWSGDRAALPKQFDRLVVVAGFPQYLVGVLADRGWTARPSLVLARNGNRTCDRQHRVVVERDQDVVGHDLAVIGNVLCGGHDVEHDPAGAENFAPFGSVFG